MEELIERLFSQTTQDLTIWQRLTEKFDADLFCGLWCERWNREIDFSPEILKQIVERGLRLDLDVYFELDEEAFYPVEPVELLTKKGKLDQ